MALCIKRSEYKGRDAVTVGNGRLEACFLPADGGKMARLTDLGTGREFLVQAKNSEYLPLDFDRPYIDGECSGFDDMFPTIDEGYYELSPWKGVLLKDHGEVCRLKWDCEVEDSLVRMSVHGVGLPYRLTKTVRFEEESLFLEYTCENSSGFDMDFLWAAHLMLTVEEGGRILVPFAEGSKAVCVFTQDSDFAGYGDRVDWPVHTTASGRGIPLSETLACNPRGNNYKYYFNETVPEGICGYAYPDGTSLLVDFDRRHVPYLGIWTNEGSFKGYHNIALEPCTATFDRPDRARLRGQHSTVPAGGRFGWWMSFSVAHQKRGG